jgi:protein arginine N-methyltransferase 1
MYTITDYANMMADVPRIDAYTAALRQLVRPETVVADLGAGAGTFSLLAARLGSHRVYAIEPDDAIHVGRALAAANALDDRISFIQARSTDISLPQRATLIVSDLRGTLPLFQRHIPVIADARERLLASGGALIPRRDRLWGAIVEAPIVYAEHVAPWNGHGLGIDMRALQHLLINTWRRVRLSDADVISGHQRLAVLDYATIESHDMDVESTWIATRNGTAHGLCVWFETELADGIGFSNAPQASAAIHGQAFFPFGEPVALREHDALTVRLQANLVGEDYIWRWSCAGHNLSTLHGVPLGTRQLAKGAESHVPVLTRDGEIDLFVLSRMRDSMPVGEIARQLLDRFPSAIRDRNAALGRAGDLSRKYAKD